MPRLGVVRFFKRSIRNKLVVALPLLAAFVLLFPFGLSILSLRQNVITHFISTAHNYVTLLLQQAEDNDLEQNLRANTLNGGLQYVQVFDQSQHLQFQYSHLDDYLMSHREVMETLPPYKAMQVRKIALPHGHVMEFEIVGPTKKKTLVAGFSIDAIEKLVITQGTTLVAIALVTIIALIVATAALGHLVSDPVKKLADQAKVMAEGQGDMQFAALANREDEVGFLARQMNALLTTVQQQGRRLTEHTVDAALGKIASQVAHDIRSPLSSLKAAVGMLRSAGVGTEANGRKAPQHQDDALNLLQLGSARLERIANDLLTRRTAESPGGVVHTDVPTCIISIHELCDELLGEFEASPLGKGIKFVKRYHGAALYVRGDWTALQRAVGNVLKNALEAMENDIEGADARDEGYNNAAGQLIVTTTVDGTHVILRITDTGRGMTAATVAKILQGGHTEGKADGHGIGMQVVREVITGHHGALAIESTVGHGSSVFLRFPRVQAEDIAAAEACVVPWNGQGPLVIIDDEPSLREQWRLVLQQNGIACVSCASWEEYVLNSNGDVPSTAIVDYHFDNSEVDGLAICRRLQTRGVQHLLLCTAEYWKPSIRAAAAELGLTLCPKPLPRIVVTKTASRTDAAAVKTANGQQRVTEDAIAAPGYRVLLIDDDDMIGITWQATRMQLGIREFVSARNVEELQAQQVDVTRFDVVFVDKQIEHSAYDGVATVTYLRQQGARRIVLASGEHPAALRADPLAAVVDAISEQKVPSSLQPYV